MTTTATGSKTSTVDAAAQASIGAAARKLHLPTVRAEAGRLAEIAIRERKTHLAYLAEVLAAEVDDRNERRRTRRINNAKFPRLKRLADFNADAVPTTASAPSAPTNVRATASGTSATAWWAAPTSTGGSGVTGYRVGRDGTDSSGAGPWSTTVSATTTSFRFDKLKPGRTYRLSIQAVNAVATGPATTVTVVAPA